MKYKKTHIIKYINTIAFINLNCVFKVVVFETSRLFFKSIIRYMYIYNTMQSSLSDIYSCLVDKEKYPVFVIFVLSMNGHKINDFALFKIENVQLEVHFKIYIYILNINSIKHHIQVNRF